MSGPEKTESTYRWLSLGLLLACVCLAFATIDDYGMGWDEVTRWNSGDAKVEYYQALAAADDLLAVVHNAPSDNYPGFFDMQLSLLHRLTGWDRFVMGHWMAYIFGLAGLLALWRIGSVFGGARLGCWSVVFLLLTPSFYGHWFHNPKDVPFAATYTIGLWALIECFRRYPNLSKRWMMIAAIACGLCMATRIAGMVLLAYFVAGVGAVVLVHLWGRRASFDWRVSVGALRSWLIAVPLVVLVAYIALLPWWPGSHKDLLSVSGSTLQRLHISASEIPLLFRGDLIWAADAPHHYTIWMFAIKAPEVLLIGLLLSLPFIFLCGRAHVKEGGDLHAVPSLAILILGGVFPLLYLTITAPALHNGARHFLFVFPALCICAAWGHVKAGEWLQASRPALLRPAQLAFAILLLLPLYQLVQLHPYQYIYYNALVGGPGGAFGRYEGEYWFTSSKHAVEQLERRLITEPDLKPKGRPVQIFILGPWQVAEPFLPGGYELTGDAEAADYLILNTQMLMHTGFEGEELFRIERMGMPICYIYF